jgi:hypothetical protein
MLFLSHCDHASNGAKAAEPEFGMPVSPAFSPESGINYSPSYPQRPLFYTLYYPILAFYREPV